MVSFIIAFNGSNNQTTVNKCRLHFFVCKKHRFKVAIECIVEDDSKIVNSVLLKGIKLNLHRSLLRCCGYAIVELRARMSLCVFPRHVWVILKGLPVSWKIRLKSNNWFCKWYINNFYIWSAHGTNKDNFIYYKVNTEEIKYCLWCLRSLWWNYW